MDPIYLAYALPLGLIIGLYVRLVRQSEARSRTALATSIQSGLSEPPSLHPIIDRDRCVGCGACVRACPEGAILGLVGGRAELIEPSSCIGHGACKAACPVGAISLVFGTATRGVDIPNVSPTFETNVAGIFIAGELGGMGLIRNAIEQGRQAVEAIAARGTAPPGVLDLVIVGAGPAGLSASLAAQGRGLNFVTIEQDTIGGTVAHFPRGKLVMTTPVVLPLVGTMPFREVGKECLMAYWQNIAGRTELPISTGERVERVERRDRSFVVHTNASTLTTKSVLLAIGRRGSPRPLGVEGEELAKVVYRLIDPEQYRGQHVLVVGGGDSALEAAISLAELPDTAVTLSYRGSAFSRTKPKNRQRLEEAAAGRRALILMESRVLRISPDTVEIEQKGYTGSLKNDAVIVCAGGVLPAALLKSMGIEIETKHGTA
ncbi:MAG: NAD(P)-binding domain-containing protein [Proteobacteria bacterium]|nr:NAD(P)-binding domain-containing protein [Pseudomonadota bacterium]